MSLDLESLLQVLVAQTEENLDRADQALLRLEREPGDTRALDEVFRVVHTLKGDASSVELTALAELAHGVEDALDDLREGQGLVTPSVVTVLLQAMDALRAGLGRAGEGAGEMTTAHRELLATLQRAVHPSAKGPVGPSAVDGGSRLPAGEEQASRDAAARTLRVDLDKLDHLLRLTGEIAVARGRMMQMLEDPSTTRDALAEMHREAERTHLDLQELVMALRMVPIGPTFRRFARVVRDQAYAHGKQAHLVTEGDDVEVDSSVLQLLRDPLTHLVRNALDHGIEPPEERAARGKPAGGRISLRASHEAGNVVIELADDGAGLDWEAIEARARERGLIEGPQPPSRADLAATIFEAGFSTTERVTELSGRGVGMDVVRRNVEALRGSIVVDSPPGAGTRFTIRLPLTLAIIEGLLVGLGDETFVLPLDAVQESVELPRAAADPGQASGVLVVRGKTLPFVRLRHLFNLPGDPPARENVVVVQDGSGLAGLVVDALHGQRQTVIKPLTRLFSGAAGVSASAILGNGRVALILDVPGLLRRALEGEPQCQAV